MTPNAEPNALSTAKTFYDQRMREHGATYYAHADEYTKAWYADALQRVREVLHQDIWGRMLIEMEVHVCPYEDIYNRVDVDGPPAVQWNIAPTLRLSQGGMLYLLARPTVGALDIHIPYCSGDFATDRFYQNQRMEEQLFRLGRLWHYAELIFRSVETHTPLVRHSVHYWQE